MYRHKQQRKLYLSHEVLDSRELLAVAPAPLKTAAGGLHRIHSD